MSTFIIACFLFYHYGEEELQNCWRKAGNCQKGEGEEKLEQRNFSLNEIVQEAGMESKQQLSCNWLKSDKDIEKVVKENHQSMAKSQVKVGNLVFCHLRMTCYGLFFSSENKQISFLSR